MIDELDQSLERWLRAEASLSSGVAEISFDQPEKDWGESRRSVPMVNLFLYGLTPSKTRAATGSRVVSRGDGLGRVNEVSVMEARYLISVWGGGPGVEHDLLARVTNLLVASRTVPPEWLSESLRAARPPLTLSLAPDETTPTQLWSALSVSPRPSVQLLIETPLGLPVVVAANDPPRSVQLIAGNRWTPAARSRRRRVFGRTDPSAAGGRAITRRGSAVVQDTGRYAVEAAEGDEVVIEPPVELPPQEEKARGHG